MYGVTFVFSNCKTMETVTPDIISFTVDEAVLNTS